jgi:hypothetical protein
MMQAVGLASRAACSLRGDNQDGLGVNLDG